MKKSLICTLIATSLLAACATDPYTGESKVSKTAWGTGIGTLAGAGIGALIGGEKGALIGAGVGAATGAADTGAAATAPVDAPSSTTTSYTFPFTVMV